MTKVTVNLAMIEADSLQAAMTFVRRGQFAGQTELQDIIGEGGGARTGRVYTRYKPKRTIQASAAGEAPKTDTARLRQSVAPDEIRVEGDSVIGPVGIAAPYAESLEYGTERMEPRPMVGHLMGDSARLDRIGDKAKGAFTKAA